MPGSSFISEARLEFLLRGVLPARRSRACGPDASILVRVDVFCARMGTMFSHAFCCRAGLAALSEVVGACGRNSGAAPHRLAYLGLASRSPVFVQQGSRFVLTATRVFLVREEKPPELQSLTKNGLITPVRRRPRTIGTEETLSAETPQIAAPQAGLLDARDTTR